MALPTLWSEPWCDQCRRRHFPSNDCDPSFLEEAAKQRAADLPSGTQIADTPRCWGKPDAEKAGG